MFLDINKEKQFNFSIDISDSISFPYLIQNNLKGSGTQESMVLYPQSQNLKSSGN